MDKIKARRHGGALTGVLALLLVLCLVECASGSCLSYGHSCWGAHGKRSSSFLNKLIRPPIDVNNEWGRRQKNLLNNNVNAIFQAEAPDDSRANSRMGNEREGIPLEIEAKRNPAAKPMLDDDILAKINFWQMMKEASAEN